MDISIGDMQRNCKLPYCFYLRNS